MSPRTILTGLAVAAGVLFAAPAASAAVTATLNQACYTHIPTAGSDPIVATLAGGTPGANFILSAAAPGRATGSSGSTTGTFDAAGNATAQIQNISPPSGTIGPTRGQTVNLTVQDFGAGGAEQPVGQTLVTNLAMSVASRPRSPRARRQVSVSGTPFAGQRLYGFITRGSGSRVLRRISLGTANACGFVTARRVVAPRSYAPGNYRLYINAGRSLNKSRALGSRFSITRRLL
jgi:hypothetical protein